MSNPTKIVLGFFVLLLLTVVPFITWLYAPFTVALLVQLFTFPLALIDGMFVGYTVYNWQNGE
jgi:hypothetical protein